jgi:biopolymer transport protein ExbB
MNRFNRTFAVLTAALLLPAASAFAQSDAAAPEGDAAAAPQTIDAKPTAMDLDALLTAVQNGWADERKENQRRETEFQQAKANQAKLLADAEAALAREEDLSQRLETTFADNEIKLAQLTDALTSKLGTLGELFGVVRQVAGDTRSNVEGSMTSLQLGEERADFLLELGKSKKLPAIADLERLWYELQREMTESGKVTRFTAPVIDGKGEVTEEEVIRVGTFVTIADGRFLVYQDGKLKELGKQPGSRYTSTVDDFAAATDGLAKLAIDPGRGGILALLVNTPTFQEQLGQGGPVGATIIVVGLLTAILAVIRWVMITNTSRKVSAAQKNPVASNTNPLGRVIAIYEENAQTDPETLELKLDEAIMKETAKLERFIWLIKVVSVVAPLMGLLGTVTGMIQTFQMITLFGTGDPKMMADGISVALVTTMLGLYAAIPLVLLHAAVANSSKRVVDVLEEQSTGLVAARAEGSN